LIQKPHPFTPSVMSYQLFEETKSLYNTPPVFCWYVLGLILDWAIAQGGVSALDQLSRQKSALLYDIIDSNEMYINHVDKSCRSRINVPFSLKSEELENRFLKEVDALGLKQLKGHKAAGGCRASIYNAMPLEGVQALVDFMRSFSA
jgi:phosphoserine aminotransferase